MYSRSFEQRRVGCVPIQDFFAWVGMLILGALRLELVAVHAGQSGARKCCDLSHAQLPVDVMPLDGVTPETVAVQVSRSMSKSLSEGQYTQGLLESAIIYVEP